MFLNFKKKKINEMCSGFIPVTPELKRQRQEDYQKFKTSLVYIMNLGLLRLYNMT